MESIIKNVPSLLSGLGLPIGKVAEVIAVSVGAVSRHWEAIKASLDGKASE